MANDKIVYEVDLKVDNSKKSLNDLNNELKEVTEQLNKMSTEQLKNDKSAQDLIKRQKELSGAIAEHGEASKTAGQKFKESFNEMTGGIVSAGKALIANPIGLILTAIVVAAKQLYEAFQRSSKGQELLAKGMGVIKGIGAVVAKLFNGLADILIKTFTEPQQAIKDLWEGLKTNFVNRLDGVIEAVKAAGKVIGSALKFDWDEVKEGAEDFGKAMFKASTGFKAEDVVNGIKKVGKEIGNVVTETTKLTEALLGFKRLQNQITVTNAELEKQRAVQAALANDTTKSLEERAKAAKQELEISKQIESNNLKIAKTEEELAIAEAKRLNDNSIETQTTIAQLTKARIDAETQYETFVRDANQRIREIDNETLDSKIKAEVDFTQRRRDELQKQIDDENLPLEEREKALEEFKKLSEDSFNRQLKIFEETTGASIDANKLKSLSDAEQVNEYLKGLGLSKELTDLFLTDVLNEHITVNNDIVDAQKTVEEAREKSLDNQLKAIDNELELEKKLIEGSTKSTEDVEKAKVQAVIDANKKKLEAIKKTLLEEKNLTEEQKEGMIKQVVELQNAIDAAQVNPVTGKPRSIGDLLGISEENQEAVNEGISKTMEIWGTLNEQLNTASDRRIEKIEQDADLQLTTTQNLGDAEKEAILANQELTGSEKQRLLVENAVATNNKIAKIEADKEKKVEAEKKKQFKRDKAFQIAQAIISVATGVTKALGSSPPPLNAILAGITAASGAVQIATIASQKYAAGGLLQGPLHAAGGIMLGNNEVEGGEFVINRAATAKFAPVLDKINKTGNATGNTSEVGDIIDYDRLAAAMQSKKVYVVSSEITDQQAKDTNITDSVTF